MTYISLPRMLAARRSALAVLAVLAVASAASLAGAHPTADADLESNAVAAADAERGGRAGPGAGAARAVLAEMARELISRSATSSQVGTTIALSR